MLSGPWGWDEAIGRIGGEGFVGRVGDEAIGGIGGEGFVGRVGDEAIG